jgi:hypothetical protein
MSFVKQNSLSRSIKSRVDTSSCLAFTNVGSTSLVTSSWSFINVRKASFLLLVVSLNIFSLMSPPSIIWCVLLYMEQIEWRCSTQSRNYNILSILVCYLLRVLSFNCKNIKTCGPFFYDVLNNVDIVMLQEHWLFKCQLAWLEEIHADFTGCGKSVDNTDPLCSTQSRNYNILSILVSLHGI